MGPRTLAGIDFMDPSCPNHHCIFGNVLGERETVLWEVCYDGVDKMHYHRAAYCNILTANVTVDRP